MPTPFRFDDDMRRGVTEQSLAFFATVNADGTPNLSPKGTVRTWGERQLVFAHVHSPGTVSNLRANPAIEVNVVDPIVRKGYRFRGAGRVLESGPEWDELMAMYRETTVRADERIRAVVVIDVIAAEPLTSPAYDLGMSEGEVRDLWMDRWRSLYRF
jgi:predicted pyridoxine 5'-phosphate oxidase superfamily flavin-nucleotide-binding protein